VPSKIHYLMHAHKRSGIAEAPALMAALDLHFGQGWTDRANAAAWRADIGTEALDDAKTAELLNDPTIAGALDKIGAEPKGTRQ